MYIQYISEMGDLDEDEVPENSYLHKFSLKAEKRENEKEESHSRTPTNDIEAINGTCSMHGTQDRSMKKYCFVMFYNVNSLCLQISLRFITGHR